MNDNIYSAPSSQLSDTPAPGQYGSLERGINGDYEFSVSAILSEAWARTKGAKGTMLLAMLMYMVISALISVAITFIFTRHLLPPTQQPSPHEAFSTILSGQFSNLIVMIVLAPLITGQFMLGVRRAVGVSINPMMIFGYYNRFAALAIAQVLVYITIIVGYLLLIIPGIYLSVALLLTAPLVADKKISPIAALKASRAAVSKRWFGIFGLLILLGLLNAATVFTFFIGMIWTLPMTMIALGILYRNIFGCEAETIAE